MRITKHSKQRIIERDDGVNYISEAKKVAKLAFTAGKTIADYQKHVAFYEYLKRKKEQTHDCSLRVYRGNIYIWKGRKKSLVTAYPIPNRFKKELEI